MEETRHRNFKNRIVYNLLSVINIVCNLILKVYKKKFQNTIDFIPYMLYHYKCSKQGKQKKKRADLYE